MSQSNEPLTERWYHVGAPWADRPGAVYAGSEDPHAGTYIVDCSDWPDELHFGEPQSVDAGALADLIVRDHNEALAVRAKAEPTPGASEGLVDRETNRLCRWLRVNGHTIDGRSDGMMEIVVRAALAASPVAESPAEPLAQYGDYEPTFHDAVESPAEPTPGASEGLVDELALVLRDHFVMEGDAEDVPLDAGDIEDARAVIAALAAVGIRLAASPVAESPAEPERTDLRAAVQQHHMASWHAGDFATGFAFDNHDQDPESCGACRRLMEWFAAASPSSDTRPGLDVERQVTVICDTLWDNGVYMRDSVPLAREIIRRLASPEWHHIARQVVLDRIREETREAVIEGDAQDCSSPDCIADAVYEIVRAALASRPEPPAREPT